MVQVTYKQTLKLIHRGTLEVKGLIERIHDIEEGITGGGLE